MLNKWAQDDDDDDDNADNPRFFTSFAQSRNSNQANSLQGPRNANSQSNPTSIQQSNQRSNAPPQPIVKQQNSLSNQPPPNRPAYVEYRGSFPVNAANPHPIVKPQARYPPQTNHQRGGNNGGFSQQHPQQFNSTSQQPPRQFPGQSFEQIQQYDRGRDQNYQQQDLRGQGGRGQSQNYQQKQQYPAQDHGGGRRNETRGHDSQQFTAHSGSDRQFQYSSPRRSYDQLRNGYRQNGQLSFRGSQNPSGTRTFELITGDEHLENEKATFVVCAFNPMHLYPSSGIQAHQSTCPNRPVSE